MCEKEGEGENKRETKRDKAQESKREYTLAVVIISFGARSHLNTRV